MEFTEAMREFVLVELRYYPYSLITNLNTFPCSICDGNAEIRMERDLLNKLPMEENSFSTYLKEIYHQMLHLSHNQIKENFYNVDTIKLCNVQYIATKIMEKDKYGFGIGRHVHDAIWKMLFER